MKTIITAIGTPNLNEKLKQENEFQVMSEDILYKEGILEFLEKNANIDICIISELLPGNMETKQLIEKINELNANIQIIIFLEKENKELENYLYAKGIQSIFYHNQVEIKQVISLLKNNTVNQNDELKKEIDELKKMLLEKEQKKKMPFYSKYIKKQNNKPKKEYAKFSNKQIICVSGTNGVGKSIFTINIAKTLSEVQNKILIIDFDVLNNSLHTILGIKKYSEKIKERMKKNNLLKEMPVEELIIKVNSKIDLITGVNLLFDTKYQISSMKIKNMLEKLKQTYDVIIIDTTSECFFDYTKEIMKMSNQNVFILEANLLEIKKAKRLLNIYISEWKIPQTNFNILFNKYNQNSIDSLVLKNVFSDFKILGKLSASSKYNLLINKKSRLNESLKKEYLQIGKKLFQNN